MKAKGFVKCGVACAVVLLALGILVTQGVFGFGPSREINLADADLTFVAEDYGDWTGYFASPAGDVNGDGLGDVLVGAPMAGNKVCPYPLNPDGTCPGMWKGQGVGYLVLGRPLTEWPSDTVSLTQADASFLGCETNSMTARQLYTAGDVNGDGYDDFLISGWKCGVNYTGKAYLFLGRPDAATYWGTKFPVEDADVSFLGEHEWDFLSYYLATAGDVNADGYDDILISSTHYDISGTNPITDVGKIYLFLGRPDAESFWGNDYPVAQADATFLGEAEGDRIGRAVAGLGDVNGDGYGDFIVGSISSDDGGEDAGEGYFFLGRAEDSPEWWGLDFSVAGADASFVGEAEGDEAGRRVADAGDVNGDGLSDFLVGSALNDTAGRDAGKGYLILGRLDAATYWGTDYPLALVDASFTGEVNRDQAARRLTGVGDINADGYDDMVIGAPHNERGGELAGTAYLIYGRPAADWGSNFPLSNADVAYVGKPEIGVAGYDQGWIGDMDGDEIDDFLIAAYGGRNDNDVLGEVYIIRGSVTPEPYLFTPDAPDGAPGEWHSFTTEYWDPNGWQDFERVQMMIGRVPGDPKGLQVMYEAATHSLYLSAADDPAWLGPCTPGTPGVLSNGVVQMDCLHSAVYTSTRGLQVIWWARWMVPVSDARYLTARLRALDQLHHDSGMVVVGSWSLLPGRVQSFLPIVVRD